MRLAEPEDRASPRAPFVFPEENSVAIYSCPKCGMSVGTMTCGHCGKELEHDSLTLDGGATVAISQCPDGHGKVKSPMCCAQDMTCSVA